MSNLSLRPEEIKFVPLPRDKAGSIISINSRKAAQQTLKINT